MKHFVLTAGVALLAGLSAAQAEDARNTNGTANVGVGINSRADIGRDASGGVLANSDAGLGTNISSAPVTFDDERERNVETDTSDSRFNSGVSSGVGGDVSAGGDSAADLRAQIRSDVNGSPASARY